MPKKYEIIEERFPDGHLRRKRITYTKDFVSKTGHNPTDGKEIRSHRNLSQLGTCELCWSANGRDLYFGDNYLFLLPNGTPYAIPRFALNIKMRIYMMVEPPAKLFRFVRS